MPSSSSEATAAKQQQQQQQYQLQYLQKPRASYPEIMNPRLSLNGTLRHLVPSPGPLYREHSSRSIQPLTANEQQMAELDGSLYGGSGGGSVTRSGYLTTSTMAGAPVTMATLATSTATSGGSHVSFMAGIENNCSIGGSGLSGAGGGAGTGGVSFHTTELSITPSMTGDDQCIDLGSLRRFSIDRHSFLGKIIFLKL